MVNNFEHPLVYTLIYIKPTEYEYERGLRTHVTQEAQQFLFCNNDFEKLIEQLTARLINDRDFFLSDENFTDYVEVFVNGFHIEYACVFDEVYDGFDNEEQIQDNIGCFREQVISILTKYKEQIDQRRIQHKIDERVKEQQEINKKLDLQRAEQQRLEYEYFIQLKQKFEGKDKNE